MCLSYSQNDRDEQIAANGLSTPQDAIAILLHRLVRTLSCARPAPLRKCVLCALLAHTKQLCADNHPRIMRLLPRLLQHWLKEGVVPFAKVVDDCAGLSAEREVLVI